MLNLLVLAATITCVSYIQVTGGQYITVYEGCFVDEWTRALPDVIHDLRENNSVEACSQVCYNRGPYQYAGLQYEYEYFCGDSLELAESYGLRDESECNARCSGDLNQFCGGAWRNSIYSINLDTSTLADRREITQPTTTVTTHSERTNVVIVCLIAAGSIVLIAVSVGGILVFIRRKHLNGHIRVDKKNVPPKTTRSVSEASYLQPIRTRSVMSDESYTSLELSKHDNTQTDHIYTDLDTGVNIYEVPIINAEGVKSVHIGTA